jgi:Icc-related predicted phosphoesterase
MRTFLFSDLHANYKQLCNIKDYVRNEDIKTLIFAGDLVNMGEPVGFAEEFISVVKLLNVDLLWVPGNNDFGRSYFRLCKEFKSLEGKIVYLNGRKFTGVGGSPASWAGQYSGENLIDNESIDGSIFVSHVPPPGIHNYQKKDCISPTSNKRFSHSPLIHICGHDHFRWGCAYLGETKIVKLAPAERGFYGTMDLDTLDVEFNYFK